jgi:hypothetical protein
LVHFLMLLTSVLALTVAGNIATRCMQPASCHCLISQQFTEYNCSLQISSYTLYDIDGGFLCIFMSYLILYQLESSVRTVERVKVPSCCRSSVERCPRMRVSPLTLVNMYNIA